MIKTTFKRLHTRRAAPGIALLVSGGLLAGAWVFQYGLGYAPCTMCYWQRHAHKVVVGLAAFMLVLRAFGVKLADVLIWLVVAALLVSFGLAAWHAGVEYGIFEELKVCTASGTGPAPTVDPNDPLAFLDKSIKPPACSEAVWHFLGLSMASWNAVISLITALFIATSKKT